MFIINHSSVNSTQVVSGSFSVCIIRLVTVISITHFCVLFSLLGTGHTYLFLWLLSTDFGVYPLLICSSGESLLYGSSVGTWAFTTSNPLLHIPSLFGAYRGLSVSEARTVSKKAT